MKRFFPLLLALGSGILLSAAWPVSPLTFLIFVAWVPLLWMELVTTSRKKFFAYTYLCMLVWNVATTWWIWNASAPGSVGAFLANSLLMCFPWIGYRAVRRTFGNNWAYVALISFWMCFEYIHLQDWGLSWPWLTLGNVFATHTSWIQWYEYTGTSGGSFWILLANILLFAATREYMQQGRNLRYALLAGGWFLTSAAPILISSWTKYARTEQTGADNIVIVQPNIDPYEKISTGSFDAQLARLISLSETQIDENTRLVVWPETALYMENGIDELHMKENFFLRPLWGFLQRHPQISLFTGIESYRSYTASEAPPTARKAGDGIYYEAFNGCVLLDSAGAHSFYHKSMLVPGVETLPWFLRFIDQWFEKFGGTSVGYTKQKERSVLPAGNGIVIAPAICYESIYGEFMSRYTHNGATLIGIITNDGWWDNTPGHKQHLAYARLRAIENRRWILRSANTGISCFIDPAGNVINPQGWNTASAIRMRVPFQDQQTFYSQYGDILSKLMCVVSILLVSGAIFVRLKRRFVK